MTGCPLVRTILAVLLPVSVLALIHAVGGCGGEETRVEPFPDRLSLAPADSIGEELGDSVYTFGFLIDACTGPSGEVLALDQAQASLRAFGRDGEFLGYVARRGEGPGELGMPMFVASLGDSLVMVMDPMKGGHVVWDRDYSLLDEIALWPQNPPMFMWGLDGAAFLAFRIEAGVEEGGIYMDRMIGRYELGEADPEVVYWQDRVDVDPTSLTRVISDIFFFACFAADPEGERVFVAPFSTSDYGIHCYDREGNLLYTISQLVPRAPKDDAEMLDEEIFYESYLNRLGAQGVVIDWEPDPYRYMISALGVDCFGRLWVVRGTEHAPVLDVYDMEGRHLFSCVLPRESRSWTVSPEPEAILAFEEDPLSGYQKLYIIEYPAP
ncbi:hypothetical protein JW921_06275 [Candidatus Fermentibacterales bacterium]|nr:hypothetical protein [Candidatus Fermentibacterales bacterium]